MHTSMCVCLYIAHILTENSAIAVTSTAQELQKAFLVFIYCIFFRFLCCNIIYDLRKGFNQSVIGSRAWVCVSNHPNTHT